jgi:serine/threonine protein kinase
MTAWIPADPTAARPGALARGERLGGYEIVRLIGFGGMGQVYRARDTRLGREVAVKVLSPHAADAQALSRLAAEARAASALNHPNLITVFELVEDARTPYIVTELVEGRTVREALRDGPLPLEEALDVARQAAEGLARAHASGIVHRDVKPENLMVRTDRLVKLLDFGLVKWLAPGRPAGAAGFAPPLTAPGFVIGTAGYMSPEQVRGEAVGTATDVFALGIVLSEMLSGRHPFLRDSSADTMSAILRNSPEPLPASVPAEAAALVRECLEKSAGSRPAASEVAARLAALRPPAATVPPPAEEPDARSPSPSPRRGLRFLLALAGALALAGFLARTAPASAHDGASPARPGGRAQSGTKLAPGTRQEVEHMSDSPRSILMPDSSREDLPQSTPGRRDEQVGENRRDQDFQEVPAPQGLKTPPAVERGTDSGEWTRGGGTDPNEMDDTEPGRPDGAH